MRQSCRFRATRSPVSLDREELGRSTWSFLHTMARITRSSITTQQQEMGQFINIFSKFSHVMNVHKTSGTVRTTRVLPDLMYRAESQYRHLRHLHT
uniref:Uncharacterized protein n=1 Tax=Maylandia zebra TaxID=106582 RepID=A0A3P9DUM8_9CICH